jgi:hypothetical protein
MWTMLLTLVLCVSLFLNSPASCLTSSSMVITSFPCCPNSVKEKLSHRLMSENTTALTGIPSLAHSLTHSPGHTSATFMSYRKCPRSTNIATTILATAFDDEKMFCSDEALYVCDRAWSLSSTATRSKTSSPFT